MPVSWPTHFVDRLADNQWVLFVGSGVSASCVNDRQQRPPTWSELLGRLSDLIHDSESQAIGHSLVAAQDLLGAADHVRSALHSELNLAGYYDAIRMAVDGPPAHRYHTSELQDALLSLEPQIVFTTNYDKLLERVSDGGFATHSFDSDGLASDLRRGTPVLVKLHGSTDGIQKIILTRSDYRRAAEEGMHVFEVFSALTLVSTILFVGYSLNDPDIQLVLQAAGRNRLNPEAHFMLAPEPASASQKQAFEESYGVSLLTYEAHRHEEALTALRDLSEAVLSVRQQRVQMGT